MRRMLLLNAAVLVLGLLGTGVAVPSAGLWRSTRIVDPGQHARTDRARYPYRAMSEYVLRELDLQDGDVLVDIGAGDGWWSEQMAGHVGPEGIVRASEVVPRLVERMNDRFGNMPQVRPYLSPTDGTGLPEDSCDVAFLSQTYHHLDAQGRPEYLRHLHDVVKPTGRLFVIERCLEISGNARAHGTFLSQLVQEAERANWILVRYELMPGTHHYLAIFVQKSLFASRPMPRTAMGC